MRAAHVPRAAAGSGRAGGAAGSLWASSALNSGRGSNALGRVDRLADPEARIALANRLIDAEAASARGPTTAGRLHRLCSALARALPAAGAAVTLLTGDSSGGGVAAASGPATRYLEELQLTLAEGPSNDAFATRYPVLEPDLVGRGVRRWPGFGPAASEQGMCAVFAFPVQIGAARLGTLSVYRREPSPLSAQAVGQAVTFAEVALGLLLEMHSPSKHRTAGGIDALLAYRAEVYQAQGMVMVDLGVGLAEAMLRLRGHAYAAERDLIDVSHDVVTGSLVLDRDTR